VGREYGHFYYPHISGVARSYNFYPVSHMRPEEGFAVIAFGLGVYVVEGRTGHRFSPRYPGADFGSTKDMLHSSQVQFYAVDTSIQRLDLVTEGEKAGLALLDIADAERHGSLVHCASAYDPANDRLTPSLRTPGPRLVNFADILKHNYIPLADTVGAVMDTLKDAMGVPVEIEFAVDLGSAEHQPSLYVLQVKPLAGEQLAYELDLGAFDPETLTISSRTALGNGRIDGIRDVVVVNRERFDRLKTRDMVAEVEYFNRKLAREGQSYLLLGPGRWGSRDPSLGVPVNWMQIAGARVIVEVGFEGYPLDASLGSHFFHNVTALNIGYIAVQEGLAGSHILWPAFESAETLERLEYFRHVRFDPPLTIHLDGRRSTAAVVRA